MNETVTKRFLLYFRLMMVVWILIANAFFHAIEFEYSWLVFLSNIMLFTMEGDIKDRFISVELGGLGMGFFGHGAGSVGRSAHVVLAMSQQWRRERRGRIEGIPTHDSENSYPNPSPFLHASAARAGRLSWRWSGRLRGGAIVSPCPGEPSCTIGERHASARRTRHGSGERCGQR